MRSKARETKIAPEVVYEDSSFMVLNKPSGWVVPETQSSKAPSVELWLHTNSNFEILNLKVYRSGIVHRLDKETSGLLVVAKTKDAFHYFQKKFKERKIRKTYLALLHGKVEPEIGEINASVGRLPWNRERFGVLAGGREAKTKYKLKAYYLLQTTYYSLVEFYPQSGRTHQIRVHAKHIGHPIVADIFYAGRKTARRDREWCPRLFLHASKISFEHPESGEEVSFESVMPDDLFQTLSSLQAI